MGRRIGEGEAGSGETEDRGEREGKMGKIKIGAEEMS